MHSTATCNEGRRSHGALGESAVKQAKTHTSTSMHDTNHTNRRTVLKTLGATVVGGVAATGTAAASHDPSGDILLEDLDFSPDTHTVDGMPAAVTWEHNDSGGGFIHNVSIDHDDMKSRVKSNPLNHGDTYTAHFETTMIDGDKYLIVDDTDQKAAVRFDGPIDLHVHCDLHSPKMEMKRFTVKE